MIFFQWYFVCSILYVNFENVILGLKPTLFLTSVEKSNFPLVESVKIIFFQHAKYVIMNEKIYKSCYLDEYKITLFNLQ
jgi:hypothetical protein